MNVRLVYMRVMNEDVPEQSFHEHRLEVFVGLVAIVPFILRIGRAANLSMLLSTVRLSFLIFLLLRLRFAFSLPREGAIIPRFRATRSVPSRRTTVPSKSVGVPNTAAER